MAKKVVATLKTTTGKDFAKVVKVVKSPKTGAYAFKEEIIANDKVRNISPTRRNFRYACCEGCFGAPFAFRNVLFL